MDEVKNQLQKVRIELSEKERIIAELENNIEELVNKLAE